MRWCRSSQHHIALWAAWQAVAGKHQSYIKVALGTEPGDYSGVTKIELCTKSTILILRFISLHIELDSDSVFYYNTNMRENLRASGG